MFAILLRAVPMKETTSTAMTIMSVPSIYAWPAPRAMPHAIIFHKALPVMMVKPVQQTHVIPFSDA